MLATALCTCCRFSTGRSSWITIHVKRLQIGRLVTIISDCWIVECVQCVLMWTKIGGFLGSILLLIFASYVYIYIYLCVTSNCDIMYNRISVSC